MRALILCTLALVLVGSSSLADAEEISPEFQADIEQLMEVMGMKELAKQMSDAMMQVALSDPTIDQEMAEVIGEIVSELMDDPGLMEGIAPLYAKYFTQQEIQELTAFYRTPLGKKTISVMPQLMAEGMQVGQEWAMGLQPKIQQRLQERMQEDME